MGDDWGGMVDARSHVRRKLSTCEEPEEQEVDGVHAAVADAERDGRAEGGGQCSEEDPAALGAEEEADGGRVLEEAVGDDCGEQELAGEGGKDAAKEPDAAVAGLERVGRPRVDEEGPAFGMRWVGLGWGWELRLRARAVDC